MNAQYFPFDATGKYLRSVLFWPPISQGFPTDYYTYDHWRFGPVSPPFAYLNEPLWHWSTTTSRTPPLEFSSLLCCFPGEPCPWQPNWSWHFSAFLLLPNWSQQCRGHKWATGPAAVRFWMPWAPVVAVSTPTRPPITLATNLASTLSHRLAATGAEHSKKALTIYSCSHLCLYKRCFLRINTLKLVVWFRFDLVKLIE